MTLDLRCYVITTGTGRPTVQAAASAAAAGAGVIQVRAKEASTRELLDLTCCVADAVCAVAPGTRVVVDDRADVAWAARRAGAPVHGVHVGTDDLPARDARALLGPDAVIGLTTGTLALVQAAEALADVVDYVGAGPMRPTPTKDSGRPALGVQGYPPLVAATRLPVVAIGDVRVGDIAALAATGVAGVAFARAVMGAPDPGEVVRAALAEWRRGAGEAPADPAPPSGGHAHLPAVGPQRRPG